MHVNNISIRLERIVLLVVFALSSSAVQAQTIDATQLKFGTAAVTGDAATAATGADLPRLRTGDTQPVEVRHNDSLLNGALIGAGVAIASGLFICRAMEPWENCRDAGPLLKAGAFGGGVGIAIDALIRGRKTVYQPAPGSARLYAAPMIGRHAGGVQVALSF
jgi:hypothetical protein